MLGDKAGPDRCQYSAADGPPRLPAHPTSRLAASRKMCVDIHSLMHDAKDVDFVFSEDVETDVASAKHAEHTRFEIVARSPRTRPAPRHFGNDEPACRGICA